MTLALILSSVAAGTIATAVMVVFLYLPTTWDDLFYDTLGALGAIFLRRVDGATRWLGGVVLLVGGWAFAAFYDAPDQHTPAV